MSAHLLLAVDVKGPEPVLAGAGIFSSPEITAPFTLRHFVVLSAPKHLPFSEAKEWLLEAIQHPYFDWVRKILDPEDLVVR